MRNLDVPTESEEIVSITPRKTQEELEEMKHVFDTKISDFFTTNWGNRALGGLGHVSTVEGLEDARKQSND